MIISAASLDNLRVGFKTEFQNGYGQTPSMRDRVAMTVRSTTFESRYGWMKELPGMREWLGPRVVNNMAENAYSIVNRHFENTVGVDRNDIEDDNLGQYSTRFQMLGRTAAALPEQLVWALLRNGFTTNCFDGQFFFDTDHPIQDENGNDTVFANTDGGAGTPWYLLCTNGPIKPIIYQERKAPEFVSKDRLEDDNVFDQRMFVYGVDMRCNVGYGLPQMAWGSRQTLNAANYAIARAAIQNMKGDGGRPLGLMPNLLVVPPSLESQGRQLLNSEYGTGGVTNEWKGTAELLVVPWLPN
jgi:phage major head subunit gpT-like protein